MAVLSNNRKAYFNYEILETFEAGMVLEGHEVKSVKLGRMNLAGSHIVLKDEEAYLLNAQIPPYQPKNTPEGYDPSRLRKLLLKKDELNYLIGKSQQKTLTLVPLKVYTKKGKIKLEFGVGRGRKKVNKKELLKKRATDREIEREMKSRG